MSLNPKLAAQTDQQGPIGSAQYLSGYINRREETPKISIEGIMKSAGLIEQMGASALSSIGQTNRHRDQLHENVYRL